MSVIAGYWSLDTRFDCLTVVDGMLSSLPATNANESRRQSGPGWALAHRLLPITPEDDFESQPLTVPGERFWLVADARIDNRVQLSELLGFSPDTLRTTPDSAIILRAWTRWGTRCVDYLVGAFAFAVWDKVDQRLFLVRDHAGERPLFFNRNSKAFTFATTARAILSCPNVSGELDEKQLGHDLVGLPPDEFRTRFRDVDAVAAGHIVEVDRTGLIQKRYWHYENLPKIIFKRDDEYVEAFLEVFDEAVRSRLRSSGGVACELSSGLDSGSVTATAAIYLGRQGKQLNAFTSIPARNSLLPEQFSSRLIGDEGPYAAEVAALYRNIEHQYVEASGSDMLTELDRYFKVLDLPCAGALNAIWANLILDKMAASGTKVLLTGALGNFTISYTGDEILYSLFRQGEWGRTLRTVTGLRKAGLTSGRHALSLTFLSMLPWSIQRQIDPLIRGITLASSAIRRDRAIEWDLLDQFRRYTRQRATLLPRCQETYFHRNQYGEYNAAANAGWGVDVRDPTADKRVYEFCASIPHEQYLIGGQGRSLIRRAMVGRLPASTLSRTARGMQSSDWYESLNSIRTHLVDEMNRLRQSPYVNRLVDLNRLSKALDTLPQSSSEKETGNGVHQYVLTRGIAVGHFIRRAEAAFGANKHPTQPYRQISPTA